MTQTDLLVIGAGPAGCSAAIYAIRAGLKTISVGGSAPGGQLLQTNEIENYAGFVNPVGGYEIMDAMHKQCKRLGVEFIEDEVVGIDSNVIPRTLEFSEFKITHWQYHAFRLIIFAEKIIIFCHLRYFVRSKSEILTISII